MIASAGDTAKLLGGYRDFLPTLFGVSEVDLGGGAEGHDPVDGLARFKRGWSTGTRTAWLGGRVLDRPAYAELCATTAGTPFFPAYRSPARA